MSNASTGEATRAVRPREAALTAGISLAAMTLIAIPANFLVIQNMIVPGDAAATAAQIAASAGVFRIGAVALVLVAILDVVVAWGLYEVFRSVSPGLALIGAWLRVAYAAIFALAITNLFSAVRVAPTDAAAALELTRRFSDGWMMGQILFGIHLAVVGLVALRAHFIHWIFGALLIVAGAGYLFDGTTALAAPGLGVELAMFTFAGELLLTVWLLVRGPRLRTI